MKSDPLQFFIAIAAFACASVEARIHTDVCYDENYNIVLCPVDTTRLRIIIIVSSVVGGLSLLASIGFCIWRIRRARRIIVAAQQQPAPGPVYQNLNDSQATFIGYQGYPNDGSIKPYGRPEPYASDPRYDPPPNSFPNMTPQYGQPQAQHAPYHRYDPVPNNFPTTPQYGHPQVQAQPYHNQQGYQGYPPPHP